MKKVPVEKAVGMITAHDMTRIVPGEFKGVAFKKGHIIQPSDIDVLKKMGKDHIYIYELSEKDLHENTAAGRLAQAVAGEHLSLTEAAEGKVDLISTGWGMLEIDLPALEAINEIEGVILATRHRGMVVKPGEKVASGKIIPLAIRKKLIEKAESVTEKKGWIMDVLPFKVLKAGLVVTGSEVYYGRIEDAFGPVLKEKVASFGGQVVAIKNVPDDLEAIEAAVSDMIDQGCQLIMVSGGMSVDPDDLSPTALRNVATEVISYGSPMLPGAMFMMAYHNRIPLLGVPACGMFHKITVLDIILPYIFSGVPVTKKLILSKAHGGLCMKCDVCTFPHCEFGKG